VYIKLFFAALQKAYKDSIIPLMLMNDFVSVILPCRNEEKTIGACIRKIRKVFSDNKITGEIIVSDSSTDDSANIAMKLGAKVIRHNKEGYGYAYSEGFKYSKGEIIIIGDADNTYDFEEISKLLSKAKDNDIVIGSRLKGDIKKGAMPWLHRRIGNPMLSLLLRLLFGAKVSDTQSGFRLIRREAWKKLNQQTTGMEYASEMIIRAKKQNMRIAEVPISYYPRKNGTKSKLRSIRDGWKHLRFMLLYSHSLLFMFPGTILLLLGAFSQLLIKKTAFYSLISVVMIILGYQIILLGIFAKTYASVHLKQRSRLVDFINSYISLEKGMLIGVLILLLGIALIFTLKSFTISLALFIIGIQTLFSAFFMSIIGIEEK
jgi:glycosyltransferase involved in cell wall biosynthesis